MASSSAVLLNQLAQLNNPDGRVVLSQTTNTKLLRDHAECSVGICAGDVERFKLNFWEPAVIGTPWKTIQTSGDGIENIGGLEMVFRSDSSFFEFASERLGENNIGQWYRGKEAWGKGGILVSKMRSLHRTSFFGGLFDELAHAIVPKNPSHLQAIVEFVRSDEFVKSVRALCQSLVVTNKTMELVPFELEKWQKVAEERYPEGPPEPYSDDPTQWLFRGDIPSSTNPLQVAMGRLLGYSWPDQLDDGLSSQLDADGIVTLAPLVNQEGLANRLRDLLQAAYETPAPLRPKGAPPVAETRVWDETTLPRLLAQIGSPGMSLEDWLRDKFFDAHCKLFHQRPFIWHIWDGRKDGFHAFMNYHLLDTKNLENLTHVYLGEWIERQKQSVDAGESSAEARLLAAQELQRKLELIRVGEKPYDIFVRWKTLAEQPIGWEPDLNDGIRMNIRPFVEAGVLRCKVNVNWNKDRGKDPKPNVSGTVERHNDLHFSLAEKRAARELAK